MLQKKKKKTESKTCHPIAIPIASDPAKLLGSQPLSNKLRISEKSCQFLLQLCFQLAPLCHVVFTGVFLQPLLNILHIRSQFSNLLFLKVKCW